VGGWFRQISLSAAVLAALSYWLGLMPPAITFLAIAIAGFLIELVPAVLFLLRRSAEAEPAGVEVTHYDVHRIRYRVHDGVYWVRAADVASALSFADMDRVLRRLDATECDRFPGSAGHWLSESGLRSLLDRRTDHEARRFLVWCEREVFAARRRVSQRHSGYDDDR
jgi:hypothetical protein